MASNIEPISLYLGPFLSISLALMTASMSYAPVIYSVANSTLIEDSHQEVMEENARRSACLSVYRHLEEPSRISALAYPAEAVASNRNVLVVRAEAAGENLTVDFQAHQLCEASPLA